ncbi:MAG: cytochrome c [Gammaproteobacteria bacterium]|nr:cytochrome c [Gammaproteobacteria bacterium]
MSRRHLLSLFLVLLAGACDQMQPVESKLAVSSLPGQRWYSEEQVSSGVEVFRQHCAQCHGGKAEGLVADWRKKLPNGTFPPPPLDGSAHAWHHPLSMLIRVIDKGGIEFGGTMPGFAGQLPERKKLEVIAYFQNFWSDEIYENWVQMGGKN